MAKPIRLTEAEYENLPKKKKAVFAKEMSGYSEELPIFSLGPPRPAKPTFTEKAQNKIKDFRTGLPLLKTALKKSAIKSGKNFVNKTLPSAIEKAPMQGVRTLQRSMSIVQGSPKDYVKGITQSTSTMSGTRGEYSRNGIRSEFTSRGILELDNRWGRATRTEVPGKLKTPDVRTKGSLQTKGRISPNLKEMAPSLSLQVDVIMPRLRKIKGRK
jgi:hypothetical protein